MKTITRMTALAAAVLAGAGAAARAEDHAVAARAGVLGLGIEYAWSFSERFAVRAGWNGSGIGFDAEESGIRYDFDLTWDSVSLALDVHPLRSPFRVSVGALRNDNRLDAVGRTSGTYTLGGVTYSPEQIGTLTGRIAFDDTAPFLGVGWDWSRRGRRVGFSLDFGVVDQGSPHVALAADGPIAGDPVFAEDIAAEEAELRDAFDDLELLPYASAGVVFRF